MVAQQFDEQAEQEIKEEIMRRFNFVHIQNSSSVSCIECGVRFTSKGSGLFINERMIRHAEEKHAHKYYE